MTIGTDMVVLGIVIPSADPVFLGAVGLHVFISLACVIVGLVAMLLTKGRGRHSAMGIYYFWCLTGVFTTAAALAFMRWREDYILFLLGALAFSLSALGRLVIKRGWNLRFHAIAMGSSYIVLITAFYVDNGKNLPIWKHLPSAAYWLIPALVGAPLLLRTLARHPLLRTRDAKISS